jgi:predicted nicotinamide N-methyase
MLDKLFLLTGLCGHALSFSVETRKSTLLPWSSSGDDGPQLGSCVERRNNENDILEFSLSCKKEGSSENDIVVEDDLYLELTDQGPDGSLASQLWPAAMAASILLRSPEFRSFAKGKDILEVGCGVGLAGLTAAEHSGTCLLTDSDEESVKVLQQQDISLNQERLGAKLSATVLDWRDEKREDLSSVDIVLGTDIAYYYHLLRPLMDTTRNYIKEHDSLVIFIGQANREMQWALYKNLRDGCYNQLTDEHEPAWPGTTKMFLYKLQVSAWTEETTDSSNFDMGDGLIPMSVIIYQPPGSSDFSLFKPYDHIATEADDESIMKSF